MRIFFVGAGEVEGFLIEIFNGATVKLARKYKISVPINQLIYGAIQLSSS